MSATKESFHEVFKLIAEYASPILGAVMGIASAIAIGGSAIPYYILGNLNPNWNGTAGLGQAVKFITGGAWLTISYPFYHLYNGSGSWGKLIFGFLFGFSLGAGIRWIGQGIINQPVVTGFLDTWAQSAGTWASNTASGATGGS